jgi:hypothetical protein
MDIAVDCDGTLFDDNFPEIGEPRMWLIQRLIDLRKQGHNLILWTCREDVLPGEIACYPARLYLSEAVNACAKLGLQFDRINCGMREIPGVRFARKPFYDVLIDDRNLFWQNDKIHSMDPRVQFVLDSIEHKLQVENNDK